MKRSLIAILSILTLIACSRKSTGFVSKGYHGMTTWNNILFNGEMDMQKTLEGKKNAYSDDYFSILKVEPIDYFNENKEGGMVADGSIFKSRGSANTNSEQGGPYEIPESKALKAIEKHSMLIKGKEYNTMMERAYLMLGKSKMYSGDYFQAIEAFDYINKKFDKDKYKVVNNIYIAESQEQLGNMYDAKMLFEEIYNKKLKKKQEKLWAQKYSQYLINQSEDSLAFDILNLAYKRDKNKKARGRYRFIQAQLLEKIGATEMAADYYVKAFKKKPGFEMEVKSQMAIASMYDPVKDNFSEVEKRLLKTLKKGTYKEYKNEVYFTLAELSKKTDSSYRADNYYHKALSFPMSDPHVRTLTYANYGDLLYDRKDYILASTYYDSAFMTVAKEDLKKAIEKKSKNLKKLVTYYNTVQRNDSILRIVKMPEEGQRQFFTDYINELKEKEAQAELAEDSQFELNQSGDYNFTYAPKGKFYFYNESLKGKGQLEFQQKWGNRALRDNWRISTGFSSMDEDNTEDAVGISANDPRRFDVEYYLEKLPKNKRSIDSLKLQRDSAELNLGVLYIEKLEDKIAAQESLQNLISTPPMQEEVDILAHYHLFRSAQDINPAIAEEAKNYLLQKYPNSKYTQYALNPNTDYFTEKSSESLSFYAETLEEYEKGNYTQVIQNANTALERFPKDEIIAKFALLRAYSEGRLGNVEEYKQALERIVILFENTPESAKAEELLNDLKQK